MLGCSYPASTKSFIENVKDLFSLNISKEIFSSINNEIKGEIKASNIKYIAPNKLELDNVVILDSNKRKMIYGKKLTIKISLLSLLTSNVRITNAHVIDPYFHHYIEDDLHNVIEALKPVKDYTHRRKVNKTRITIEKAVLENGSYKMYHDGGVEIDSHGIFASGSFEIEDKKFNIEIDKININDGHVLASNYIFPLSNVIANNLSISDKKITSPSIKANYESAKLYGGGSLFIKERRYDINARMHAPIGNYPQGAPKLDFVLPTFNAQIKMYGKLVDPHFEVQAKLGKTRFRGVDIHSGDLDLLISSQLITVKPSHLSVGQELAKIDLKGKIDLNNKSYNFSSKDNKLLLDDIGKFFSLKEKIYGQINSQTSISGSFATPNTTLKLSSYGVITNGSAKNLSLLPLSKFSIDVDVILEKKLVINKLTIKDNSGSKINISGHGNIMSNNFTLKLNSTISDTKNYWPNEHNAQDIIANSSIDFKNNKITTLVSNIKAKKIQTFDLTGNDISSTIKFENNNLYINKLLGKFYKGSIEGNILIKNFSAQQKLLQGEWAIMDIDLSLLPKSLSGVELKGLFSANGKLGGSVKEPEIDFMINANDIYLHKLFFASLSIDGSYQDNKIVTSKILLESAGGLLKGDKLSVDLLTKDISGVIEAIDINIKQWLKGYIKQIDGEIDGLIYLDGKWTSPLISAPLEIEKFNYLGASLGTGSITVSASRNKLLNSADDDLVFSLSANLNSDGNENLVRLSYALHKKTINADVRLNNVYLNSQNFNGLKSLFGIAGKVSGHAIIEGDVSLPTVNINLYSNEYKFFDPKIPSEIRESTKNYGPASLEITNSSGLLSASACISLKSTNNKSCSEIDNITFKANGPLSLDKYSLDFSSSINHENLEEIFPWLKKELISLSTKIFLVGNISKEKDHPQKIFTNINIDKLESSVSNTAKFILTKPVSIYIDKEKIKFISEANLDFSPGELTISGDYSRRKDSSGLHLSGSIPLILARFFVPFIQRADGLAVGDIFINGDLSAPILKGHIKPKPGSTIIFNKYLEKAEIKEGIVSFEPLSENSFRVRLDKLNMLSGDGKVSFNGFIDKRHTEDNINSIVFDLDVLGNSVVIRDKLNFVETDFFIKTKIDDLGEKTLTGKIIVTDGSIHQQFDLRNFVAKSKEEFGSRLFKTLNSFDMKADLELTIRQFLASARMLNLDIETSLNGTLYAKGSIAKPKFSGSIYINEGAIMFPYLSFDLGESQINFDELSDKPFDPQIAITATQELEKADFPQISEDTTVELSLNGNLSELNLQLQPLRGDLRLSQFKIFLLLLSPRSIDVFDNEDQIEQLKVGASNAAMALSGEVFLKPLTNELQELLEGKTKTRIQFGSTLEPGGVSLSLNWRIGPRLEVQGSYMFLGDLLDNNERTSVLVNNDYILGDLKIKLLLFDHKPFGPLFLMTSFDSIREYENKTSFKSRGSVKLKYRVLSQ